MADQQFCSTSHAEIYSIFRPDIPEGLAAYIVSYLNEKHQASSEEAVDIGCGSGQSTAILAPYFQRVTGIDVSKAQIDEAKRSRNLRNVTFMVGPAEILPFSDGSVQLVTACASLHWFQEKPFFEEVRRVLCYNGVLAAYTYHFVKPLSHDPSIAQEIDIFYEKMCKELLPFFSPEVRCSLNKYKDVCFPFEDVYRPPDFRQIFDGKLSDVLGYMRTLSGFQNMEKEDSELAKKFITSFALKLKEILKLDEEKKNDLMPLYRDLYIVLCRKCN